MAAAVVVTPVTKTVIVARIWVALVIAKIVATVPIKAVVVIIVGSNSSRKMK